MNKNDILLLAKVNKNDEWYTKYSDVEKMLTLAINNNYLTKQDKIICPCDTEESNFYKYLKENEYQVDISSDYENVDYSKYNWVITNIPFSKTKHFFESVIDKNKHLKILIITNWRLCCYVWFLKKYVNNFYWERQDLHFENTPKHKECFFLSNIKNCVNYKNELIDENKIYTTWILTKTLRRDFCIFSVGKSFQKVVFNKTNGEIIKMFPNELVKIYFNGKTFLEE